MLPFDIATNLDEVLIFIYLFYGLLQDAVSSSDQYISKFWYRSPIQTLSNSADPIPKIILALGLIIYNSQQGFEPEYLLSYKCRTSTRSV
jgi:hypothetical protein